jgi:hypothetical protein
MRMRSSFPQHAQVSRLSAAGRSEKPGELGVPPAGTSLMQPGTWILPHSDL